MTALSAHAGTIAVGIAPELLTQAPTTRNGSTAVFQVSDASRRKLDPATAVVVEIDTTGTGTSYAVAPAGDYSVDYLFGRVTFNVNPAGAAIVRISGKYVPTTQLGLVRSVSLSIANDVVELQVFGDGYKRRAVTLADFSGEMSGLSLTSSDHDGGPASLTLDGLVASGSPLLIEVGKGDSSQVFRAWVKVSELSHKVTPGALYEHTVKFVGHVFQTTDGDFIAWGYGSP